MIEVVVLGPVLFLLCVAAGFALGSGIHRWTHRR
jgi:hypothetical protein